MSQAKKRLAVLTGGGDCPGLNAVIRAVVKTALNNGYEIFGIENGFNGLVTGRMGLMDYKDVSGILPRGGTILGTTNRDNPFKFAVEENGELVYYDKRAEVLANLEKHGIEALVVIGGDGSLNIAARLAKECGIKVVGVPKTIDNDLPCTERTFGFDTAMAMATEALDRIHTTAESRYGAGSYGTLCWLDRIAFRHSRRSRCYFDTGDPLQYQLGYRKNQGPPGCWETIQYYCCS